MIPNFDHPFGSACQEYRCHVCVPTNIVDWGVVCLVSLKKPRTVFSSTLVNKSFIRTNQKHCFVYIAHLQITYDKCGVQMLFKVFSKLLS